MNDNYENDIIKHALNKNDEIQTLEKVKNLVESGADINYNIPNMVYPMGDTPLMWAIYKGLSKVAKYLIDSGADLTLTNNLGQRAYHWALISDNLELAEYIKSKEPKDFHNLDLKIAQFKEFGCPQSMIDFFMQKNITIQNENCICKFYSLTDTYILNYDKHDFISLCMKQENYSSLIILWSKDLKSICSLDYEHDVLTKHCTWEDFQANMSKYIGNAICWEGEHIGDWLGVEDTDGNTPRGDIYWEDL